MGAMLILADLHVHSRFSRATSRDLDLVGLHSWALRKGLTVIGTGDFTHPAWRAELTDQLVEAEPGLFQLRPDLRREATANIPRMCQGEVRFVPQVEISTIYSAGGTTRKVHHVVLCPTLAGAEQLSAALARIGNVTSDGRPILGLDSRDLLEIVLESCPGGCLIPAHIWTPWFSVLGSKSGFDSITDCYRDLADHIFAVETGLSSDPPMNWRCSSLDRFSLVSNSDAHSPSKLGRECNLFDTDLSFEAMMRALRRSPPGGFLGTVEFFPEEGKYHLDGHRKCGQRLTPAGTRETGGRCPACGRPVTVGVMHRVEDLADRTEGERPAGTPGYESLIGLAETVGHALGRGPSTKGVERLANDLLAALGPELFVLRQAPLGDIERAAGDMVAEAIRRVRSGEVRWNAGYDGEYGTFEVFTAEERSSRTGQISMLGTEPPPAPPPSSVEGREVLKDVEVEVANAVADADADGSHSPNFVSDSDSVCVSAPCSDAGNVIEDLLACLGPEQLEAVLAPGDAPLLVVAGPGTGKTRTLTTRIAHRIETGGLDPDRVLALTFTNRAAEEMAERLASIAGERGRRVAVCTFHALGLRILRSLGRARPRIVSEPERLDLTRRALEMLGPGGRHRAAAFAERISRLKAGVPAGAGEDTAELDRVHRKYEEELEVAGGMDFDDLVLHATAALEQGLPGLPQCAEAVFVDEYQDLNPAQVRMLRALVRDGAELCAIGDPDQAIYGFRGADPDRLLRFEDDWPGARVLRLGRSYRSSDTILAAASQVIARAPGLGRPRLWSGIEGRPHLVLLTSRNEEGEAERIALFVERLLGGTSFLSLDSDLVDERHDVVCRGFGEVAVLYRLRSQGDRIAGALQRLGLPVQMASTWSSEPLDEASRILRAVAAIAGRADSHDGDATPDVPGDLALRSASEVVEVVSRRVAGVEAKRSESLTPILRIARHLDAIGRPGGPETRLARSNRPIDDLLDWVALHGEQDLHDPRAERISLLTLHASKGLEWPVAIIAGCEDGLVPYRRPGKPADLDEERRLFFVGMTRARHLLVLSRAEERSLYGEHATRSPSPFLLDIETAYMQQDTSGGGPKRRPAKTGTQLDLF